MLEPNRWQLSVEYVSIDSLKANPINARTHTRRQIRQIAASIRKFGFLNPILAGANGMIWAGHGRWEGAKLEKMTTVPVIRIEHLTPDQIRAFCIADNELAAKAGWDKSILAIELQHLMTIDADFDATITGFEIPEIDLIIEGASDQEDAADEIDIAPNLPQVSQSGDVWRLGRHIVGCADALVQASYDAVMRGEPADMVFTDPPYNVKVRGHVSGKGKTQHREFAMASGEMSDVEFRGFLGTTIARLKDKTRDGSLLYVCMDWRHAHPLLAAGEEAQYELKNICVWTKTNGGMGSLYRSQHELVLVFKHGAGPHRNNVQLGRFGRNRSNVWNYPSPSAFGRSGEEGYLAALHPTVKPVQMVADAMLDCTARGDIVLDPFLGSGSTLIAAERVGRVCRGIELDPLYVDVAIRRWQQLTGDAAIHDASGKRFDDFANGEVDE